jgi:NAD(P)-dependent dehydrogenase (short-subunit alcohol dehydrogenase family)
MPACSVPLNGKRALVTGGSSGIGASIVSSLRAAGCDVVVLDRSPDADLVADISSESAVVSALSAIGTLDIAVLSAGVGGMSAIVEMSADEWDRVIGVNLRGTFLCLRECARVMSDGGAIVAISSVSGFLADRMTAHYNVSKAGVDMLVRIAARELGPRGIRVNAVAPGTTDTPLFASTPTRYRERVAASSALGRLGTPGDVAAAVLALLELDWVTGQILVADGGLSLASPIDIL